MARQHKRPKQLWTPSQLSRAQPRWVWMPLYLSGNGHPTNSPRLETGSTYLEYVKGNIRLLCISSVQF